MAAKKNTGVMELWIGFSVIAGILLVAGMIFAWGSSGGAFEKTYSVLVSMPHVGALRAGAPIQLAGIRIGKVGDIRLNQEATAVDIACKIDYAIRLPVDSSAHVATMGIVGDSFLEVVRGQSSEFVPQLEKPDGNRSRLKGSSAGDLAEVMKTVTAVGNDVSILVNNVNDILGDDNVRRSLKASLVNINEITVNANKLLTDIQRVAAHVDTSVVHLNKTTAVIEDTANKATGIIKDAGDTVAAVGQRLRGGVDSLLSDRNLASLDASLDAFRKSADNIRRGTDKLDGLIGAVSPEKLGRLVDQAEGTIGKIGTLADKGGNLLAGLDVETVNKTIGQAGGAVERLGVVIARINPEDIGEMVKRLKEAMGDIQGFIAGVKNDIVLALAANNAATRVVDKKFKELERDGLRGADQQRDALRVWINEGLRRGYLPDPNYPNPASAPYNRNLP